MPTRRLWIMCDPDLLRVLFLNLLENEVASLCLGLDHQTFSRVEVGVGERSVPERRSWQE